MRAGRFQEGAREVSEFDGAAALVEALDGAGLRMSIRLLWLYPCWSGELIGNAQAGTAFAHRHNVSADLPCDLGVRHRAEQLVFLRAPILHDLIGFGPAQGMSLGRD